MCKFIPDPRCKKPLRSTLQINQNSTWQRPRGGAADRSNFEIIWNRAARGSRSDVPARIGPNTSSMSQTTALLWLCSCGALFESRWHSLEQDGREPCRPINSQTGEQFRTLSAALHERPEFKSLVLRPAPQRRSDAWSLSCGNVCSAGDAASSVRSIELNLSTRVRRFMMSFFPHVLRHC